MYILRYCARTKISYVRMHVLLYKYKYLPMHSLGACISKGTYRYRYRGTVVPVPCIRAVIYFVDIM